MFMQLDVNTEIYPIDKEERFLVALSTTLSLEVIFFSYGILDPFLWVADVAYSMNHNSLNHYLFICIFS